jgi:hypothetical protein
MRTRPLLQSLLAIAATSLVFACADDERTPATDEVGDGDGDLPGDGDGEPGDGDGEPGDGDGAPGDGDGAPGDGDGEDANACQLATNEIAPQLAQTEGGCSIVVRFSYLTQEPTHWAKDCRPYEGVEKLTEEQARALSECCSEGTRLGEAGDENIFVFYSAPEPRGGVSVISNHLGQRSFEGTIVRAGAGEGEGEGEGEAGEIVFPMEWQDANQLGSGCQSELPSGPNYDLNLAGQAIDQSILDALNASLARTALVPAINLAGKVHRTMTMVYPRTADPSDAATTDYVMIIESGT